jgi:hypothetical protein
VWVDTGRDYLADLISLDSFDPDVTIEDRRVSFLGLGIGGVHQTQTIMANTSPIVDSYPPGYDPLASGGNDYDPELPTTITTLERPVRITAGGGGGLKPYPGAPGGPPDPDDVWLAVPPPPRFSTTFTPTKGEVRFRTFLDTNAGDMTYGPFTQMPVSEAGLFLAGSDPNQPYNTLVAYHSFVTILVSLGTYLEILWKLNF